MKIKEVAFKTLGVDSSQLVATDGSMDGWPEENEFVFFALISRKLFDPYS